MLALTLLLTGCGGGGTSSGAGPTPAGVGAAGTYGGNATLTVSGGPANSVSVTGPVTITISPTGMVTVDTGDVVTASGALTGESFEAMMPLAPIGNQIGIPCSGDIVFNGTVAGTSITGNVSSTSGSTCAGMPANWSGSFTASKVGKAPRQRDSLLMDALHRAVRIGR
jgi:hypothetical protein